MKKDFGGKWFSGLHRFRWLIGICFAIAVVFGGMKGGELPDKLNGGGWDVPGSESLMAKELVAEGFVGRGDSALTLITRDSENAVDSDVYNRKLGELQEYIQELSEVQTVYTVLDAPDSVRPSMIGKDPGTSIGFVGLAIDEGQAINRLPKMQKQFIEKAEEVGLEAYLVGVPAFWGDVAEYSQKSLMRAELIVLPLLFVVLLIIFRSFASTITALVTTVVSIVSSMGLIYVAAHYFDVSVFVTNAVVMLGLGVGIDYSLIMIHRFKLELVKSEGGKKQAIIHTLKTSGHTVLFSGITIIAAMSALFIVDLAAIRSIAFGAALVVFMAILTNLVLLPVILYMLGDRIHAWKVPFIRETKENLDSKWYRWTHFVMKRPFLFLAVSLLLLIVLALPAKGLETFTPDSRILPAESTVKQGVDLVEETFGIGTTSPLSIVIHSEAGQTLDQQDLEYTARLTKEIQELDGSMRVLSPFSIEPEMNVAALHSMLDKWEELPAEIKLILNRFINEERNTFVIDVDTQSYAASDVSMERVRTIKEAISHATPADHLQVFIGGQTMEGHEANEEIDKNLLPMLGIMLAIVYVILLMTFRSIWLPLKAILMNLLSIGATFGILVFVIGEGHGAALFSIEANGYIQNFVPILMLALLFGLSTDYEVFLLNRIKEEYKKTKNNDESVAVGLNATGPLISGAALLMIAVFSGFALSGMLPIQTLGLGMAVAILIDATIIRFILVPVSMKLLGNLNWWFPFRSK
ncbi:RND superfamily putative drug exporter [Sporosarcina luteola]|nr:RND superfamily putative drug exporter [Sporosarcina luteola]